MPRKGSAVGLHPQVCFKGKAGYLIERELVGKE